jgi:hypothetical protein
MARFTELPIASTFSVAISPSMVFSMTRHNILSDC